MSKDRGLDQVNHKLLKNSSILQDTLRNLLARDKPVSVLEIGCGFGKALMELAWEFRNAPVRFYAINKERGFPLDSSEDLRKTARKYAVGPDQAVDSLPLPELSFGDATELKFQDDNMDLIFLSSVIRFIPRKAEFIEEICRVLKPGGIGILRVSASGWDYPHGFAEDSMRLTSYPTRLVLICKGELIPLEQFLSLYSGKNFVFTLINKPTCVLRIEKKQSCRISLNLVYDEFRSVPMDALGYGDSTRGVNYGGFRSVYSVSEQDYERLLENGLLTNSTGQKSFMPVYPGTADDAPIAEGPGKSQVDQVGKSKQKNSLLNCKIGQRVKAKGLYLTESRFQANKIALMTDLSSGESLEGLVDWVNSNDQTFGLLGLTVHPAEPLRQSNLNLMPQMFVKVSGKFYSGGFLAEHIQIKEKPSICANQIQGIICEIDAENGVMELTGIKVFTDMETKMKGFPKKFGDTEPVSNLE